MVYIHPFVSLLTNSFLSYGIGHTLCILVYNPSEFGLSCITQNHLEMFLETSRNYDPIGYKHNINQYLVFLNSKEVIPELDFFIERGFIVQDFIEDGYEQEVLDYLYRKKCFEYFQID